MVFDIRIVADRGKKTLYLVTRGLRVISTHRTRALAEKKIKSLRRR